MTTDIERQFFDTFGIETKYIYHIKDTSTKFCYYSATKKDILDYFTNKNHRKYKVFNVKIEHPQITDRILLELMCIANHNDVYVNIEGTNIEEIKNNLLKYFIFFRRDVKKYVQKLFKGK